MEARRGARETPLNQHVPQRAELDPRTIAVLYRAIADRMDDIRSVMISALEREGLLERLAANAHGASALLSRAGEQLKLASAGDTAPLRETIERMGEALSDHGSDLRSWIEATSAFRAVVIPHLLRQDASDDASALTRLNALDHLLAWSTTLVHEALETRVVETERDALFLRSIVENIPYMIFVKDARTCASCGSTGPARNCSAIPREELIGKNDYDFFPKDEADFFTEKDRDVLERQEGRRHSGRADRDPCRRAALPAHQEDPDPRRVKGVPRYLLGISEDITEAQARAGGAGTRQGGGRGREARPRASSWPG